MILSVVEWEKKDLWADKGATEEGDRKMGFIWCWRFLMKMISCNCK